jgi:hypothetical protein
MRGVWGGLIVGAVGVFVWQHVTGGSGKGKSS